MKLDEITSGLKPEIESIIDDILSKKSEEGRKKALEEALVQASDNLTKASKTIEELTSLVQAKESEVASLNELIESLKTENASVVDVKTKEVQELTDKLASVNAALEEKDGELKKVSEELASIQSALANAEKEKVAASRIEELKVAGLAFTSEAALEAQLSKVKNFTDEEFASYKEELATLAAQVKASITSNDTSTIVPPPTLDPNVAQAALDIELDTTTAKSKYKGLGEALSKRMQARYNRTGSENS